MAAVMAQTYRSIYLAPMGLRPRQFDLCTAFLTQAEVYAAPRAWGYDKFAREAGSLERHFTDGEED